MRALDTNELARCHFNDDKAQGKKARVLLKHAETNGEKFHVPLVVVLETIWVLDSAYGYGRSDIVNAIDMLCQMNVLAVEKTDAIRDFIEAARKSNVELSDLLIAASAGDAGCDATITFDIKAARSPLFRLLR